MRWPWGRRPADGGEQALEAARRLQRAAEDRQAEIDRLARSLARRRAVNDFGAAIEATFRGRS